MAYLLSCIWCNASCTLRDISEVTTNAVEVAEILVECNKIFEGIIDTKETKKRQPASSCVAVITNHKPTHQALLNLEGCPMHQLSLALILCQDFAINLISFSYQTPLKYENYNTIDTNHKLRIILQHQTRQKQMK